VIRRPTPQSATAPSYFEGKWTTVEDGGPVQMFYEVAPDGSVLRQIERFSDGRAARDELSTYADGLSDYGRGSLHEVSFWESEWDDGAVVELSLKPISRAAFELAWRDAGGLVAPPPGYELTEDPARIDVAAAHAYLARSYWSRGIPLATVERALANSLCIATCHGGELVGLARVVTDRATFAYLADVYVLEEHRGRGLARAMVAQLQAHPELQGLRRWLLFTADAHALYEQLGWKPLAHPERGMEQHDPDIYA